MKCKIYNSLYPRISRCKYVKCLPEARMMTFGYDSSWFGDAATKHDLTSVFKKLSLSSILERR